MARSITDIFNDHLARATLGDVEGDVPTTSFAFDCMLLTTCGRFDGNARRYASMMGQQLCSWLSMTSLLGILTACSSFQPCYVSDTPASLLRSIHVVRRGWHTGIVIPVVEWPDRRWPLLADFPEANYLEFGWGDERYFQAEENTPWLASRAALWPSASVIHVIGLRSLAADEVLADDIVEVRVSAAGLDALAVSIRREFAGATPITSGSPLSAAAMPNRFYKAKRSFYFPRMCNWWIARRLQEAGCPTQPWSVVTASRVMRDARRFR